MVAFNQSARVGSGGITYTVGADTSQIRRDLADLAKFAKEQKLKPEIDFEQTALVRGLESVRRRIQREQVKIQIVAELDQRGLADAAMKAGAITRAQLDAVRGTSGRPDINGPMAAVPVPHWLQVRRQLEAAREDYAKKNPPAQADGDPLDQLAEARRGARRAPSQAAGTGMLGGALKAGGALYAISQLLETGISAARFGNASAMAGSANPQAALTGQIGMVNAAKDIPLVGKLVTLYDEATGLTRSLRTRIEAVSDIRSASVAMAATTRSPIRLLEAQNAAHLAEMRERYAAQGIDITESGGYIHGTGRGAVSPEAQRAAVGAYAANRSAQEEALYRARIEMRVGQNVTRADIEAEGLAKDLKPFAAARRRLGAETDATARLAPPEMQELMKRLGQARMDRQLAERNRELGFAQFGSETRTAASQIRVRNRGQFFADEGTLTELRGIQEDIDRAPEEGGFKSRARVEGLARARAVRAGLNVRGGGVVGQTNLATDLVGDPFNLLPELKARGRAQRMADSFIKNLGGTGSGDLGAARTSDTGQNASVPSLLGAILQTLDAIEDSLGRGLMN